MPAKAAPIDTADPSFLEPLTQQFVDALAGGQMPRQLSPEDARRFLTDIQSGVIGKPAVHIEDIAVPTGPTGAVPIRIIRPEGAREPLPALVYAHGGGWIFGDKETHDRLIREIAVGAHVAVLFVEYDRSPEAKFPVAIEQVYAATKYLVERGGHFGLDPTRLGIAGDGVGGTIATAVTLLAKERRGPKIDVQVLFCPALSSNFDTGSYASFANGPWLTKQAMESFWEAYLPDAAAGKDISAAPLNASIDQLAGLPDALVIVAENDVLRDEGECYARHLARAGVRVTSARYNDTIHDFVLLNALADTPAARGAIAQTNALLRSILE
ncbi:alpha/beta hydrolase [Bradyrhizobium sp. CB1650]|uniref:alpha/beta hydrolase n=1 Tax=Bradyrhizobium sp. CB1650 TaxID=3039153 RepID=UPI0024353E3C|nr:alpha/beta hydrolase [Bradyrhizobium sp. CB1650]WGD50331.1 alpha/beta hydrolase [Bradyrhizobium sp. CB1650]